MDGMCATPRAAVGWRLAGVAIGLAVLWLCFGHVLAPFDLLTFLRAGEKVGAGVTPYSSVSSSTFTSGHAFVYPAFVAWLFVPLASLPAHLAVPLYTAFSVVAVFVAARWFGRDDIYLPLLVLVSSWTIVGMQMGTVNPILLLAVAAAWRWRSTRPIAAGICLGAAAGVKLFLTPLLVWPLLRRRYRSAGAGLATLALTLAFQAPLGHLGLSPYLAMLSKLQQAETGQSWSAASFLQHVGLGGRTAAEAAIGLGAMGLAGLGLAQGRLSDRQLLGLSTVVCLLVSPILWSSYLLLMAVPLLLLSDGRAPLAVAALASWIVVTPDRASGSRVAIGVGLAALVGYLALHPLEGPVPRRTVVVAGLSVAAGSLLFLLPDPIRSPLPALAAMAGIAVWTLRQPATTPTSLVGVSS